MVSMTTRLLVVLAVITAGLFCQGCISVVSYDRDLSVSDRAIPEGAIGQIETGVTTKEWVLTNFGAPTSATTLDDGVEILKYEYGQEVRTSFSFLLLINSQCRKERDETLYIQIEDDVVQRYWRESHG